MRKTRGYIAACTDTHKGEPFTKTAGSKSTAWKYYGAKALSGTSLDLINSVLNWIPWTEKHDTLWGRFSDKDAKDLAIQYQKEVLEETGDATKAYIAGRKLRGRGTAAVAGGATAEALLTGPLLKGVSAGVKSVSAAKGLGKLNMAKTVLKSPVTAAKAIKNSGKSFSVAGNIGNKLVADAAKRSFVPRVLETAAGKGLKAYGWSHPIANTLDSINETISNGDPAKRSIALDFAQGTLDYAPVGAVLGNPFKSKWLTGAFNYLGVPAALQMGDPEGAIKSIGNENEAWIWSHGEKRRKVDDYNGLKSLFYNIDTNPTYRKERAIELGLDPNTSAEALKTAIYKRVDVDAWQSTTMNALYDAAGVTSADTSEQISAKVQALPDEAVRRIQLAALKAQVQAGRVGALAEATKAGLLTTEEEQALLQQAYQNKFKLTDIRLDPFKGFSAAAFKEPTAKHLADKYTVKDPNLAEATANVAVNALTQPNSQTTNVSGVNQYIAARGFVETIKQDPNKAFEFLERIGNEGQKEAAELSPELQELFENYMTDDNATSFVSGLNDENFKKLLFFASQTAGSETGIFAQLSPGRRATFTEAVKREAQNRLKDSFKKNPLDTAPVAVCAWLAQQGVVSGETAKSFSDPFKFYGTLIAALVGIPLVFSIFKGIVGGGDAAVQGGYPNEGYRNLDAYAQRLRGGAGF